MPSSPQAGPKTSKVYLWWSLFDFLTDNNPEIIEYRKQWAKDGCPFTLEQWGDYITISDLETPLDRRG